MHTYSASVRTRSDQPTYQTPPLTTNGYCSIPQRLITDIHDSPLAIGLYGLIARLYLILQAPVPLSRADVLRYDPRLKAGAVKRAFDRLLAGAWLVENPQIGRQKHAYTPSWGRVRGAPLPWRLDQPCHGRPRHISRLPLDRSLFDICMGKLTPHRTRSAVITRYLTQPVLSLTDIGSYALTLADLPHETPALQQLQLVRDGHALQLPTDEQLLASISQHPLILDGTSVGQRSTELTLSGMRRLGLVPILDHHDTCDCSQPLFFVPPGLIGSMIGPQIGSMIGSSTAEDRTPTAAQRDEQRPGLPTAGITWESSIPGITDSPPAPPQTTDHAGGGGGQTNTRKEQTPAPRTHRRVSLAPNPVPDNETTQLLSTINVLPSQQIELADLPSEVVKTAIADGQARAGVRDLAGWVVHLLRASRDHGWTIHPPAPRSESPDALRAAFACYAADQGVEPAAELPDDLPQSQLFPMAILNQPAMLAQLWNEVQAALKLQTPRSEFQTWLRPTVLRAVVQGEATILAPNARAKEWIENRSIGAILDLLLLHTGEPLRVRVILSAAAQIEEICGSPPVLHQPDVLPALDQNGPIPPSLPVPGMEEQPDWIHPDRWRVLPVMLRVALRGSIFIDGEVQAKTTYLDRLLRIQYVQELSELIAMARSNNAPEDNQEVAAWKLTSDHD